MRNRTCPHPFDVLLALMPLYAALKRRAGAAAACLKAASGPLAPEALAAALHMDVDQVLALERRAYLPKGLDRAETVRRLEGLAALERR